MDDFRSLNKELAAQLAISGTSEILGMSVAIGSVLLARRAMPEQLKQLENMLARLMAKWRGKPPESMAKAGAKATDFLLMNIGGASNMASQFALHRLKTPEDEKLPLSQEAWRVITGRVAGTIGAASAVALAECHASGGLRRAEQALEKYLPASGKRIAPLIVSDLVQSAGALAPNTAAQVLFDHLVHRKPPGEGKNA